MGEQLNVLDLFSGLRGWSDPWREAGHNVFAIDNDPHFDADSYIDIGDVGGVLATLARADFWPDVILASPPCTSFSMMSVGTHWTKDDQPKTATAREGQRLVLATLRLVAVLRPPIWILENPRARLRSMPFLEGVPRHTVSYCRYGEDRMKPTDLWGAFPGPWQPREMCHNGNPDHTAAPRGSRTGTQGGVDSARAGLIPVELSREIMIAAEEHLWLG